MSKFKAGVIKFVRLVPRGKVVSYGQVALYLGLPRAGRQVGWVLNKLEKSVIVPWWRVVNTLGRISIKGSYYSADDQKKLLMSEGIVVADDLTFEIEKYRFIPDDELVSKLELDPSYLEFVSNKMPFSKYFSRKN